MKRAGPTKVHPTEVEYEKEENSTLTSLTKPDDSTDGKAKRGSFLPSILRLRRRNSHTKIPPIEHKLVLTATPELKTAKVKPSAKMPPSGTSSRNVSITIQENNYNNNDNRNDNNNMRRQRSSSNDRFDSGGSRASASSRRRHHRTKHERHRRRKSSSGKYRRRSDDDDDYDDDEQSHTVVTKKDPFCDFNLTDFFDIFSFNFDNTDAQEKKLMKKQQQKNQPGIMSRATCPPAATLYDPTAVTVAVEAAAVWERNKEDDNTKSKLNNDTFLSSNVVGVVRKCEASNKEKGIEVGERVASLMPWGGYINPNVPIPAQYLVPVPKDLDAPDIACLMAYYVPAFQVLHHGQRDNYRYSRLRFTDKRILITARGGACAVQLVKAIIRMSRYAGCCEIYLLSPVEEHDPFKRLDYVMVLDDEHPDHWLPVVKGQMDVIVDCAFPRDFHYVRKALAPHTGRITCYPSWDKDMNSAINNNNNNNQTSELNYLLEYCQLTTMKRASIFDYEQCLDVHREEIMDDISFLMHLLEIRQIRPEFDRYSNLKEIIRQTKKSTKNEDNPGRVYHDGALVFEPRRIFI